MLSFYYIHKCTAIVIQQYAVKLIVISLAFHLVTQGKFSYAVKVTFLPNLGFVTFVIVLFGFVLVSAIRSTCTSFACSHVMLSVLCYSAHSPLGLFSGRLRQVLRLLLT